MRVALVSDIHGNRHAFEAVLSAVAEADVTEIWCLGDLVGYGAEPDACVALAADRCVVNLAGNHDLAVTGALSLDDFSPSAAAAARWTQETLGARGRDWLASLAPAGEAQGIGLYHASPRDPIWEYVLSTEAAEACLEAADARISLIGHSHSALAFYRPVGGVAQGYRRQADTGADLAVGDWLLNPGSVGQPRDGDPRAAWLELDTTALTAFWRRTEYDVEGAAATIRAAGLPATLADRLALGR